MNQIHLTCAKTSHIDCRHLVTIFWYCRSTALVLDYLQQGPFGLLDDAIVLFRCSCFLLDKAVEVAFLLFEFHHLGLHQFNLFPFVNEIVHDLSSLFFQHRYSSL